MLDDHRSTPLKNEGADLADDSNLGLSLLLAETGSVATDDPRGESRVDIGIHEEKLGPIDDLVEVAFGGEHVFRIYVIVTV